MEPFLSERVDIAGALNASVLANVNRGKSSKAFLIEDFMVVKNAMKETEKKRATPDDREDAHLKSFILSMGGLFK